MIKDAKLELSLYGDFDCRWSDGRRITITGAKHRALIGMLAVATNGVHSRRWIQEHLWDRSGAELGRQSLRRSLSDLRKVLGAGFETIIEANNLELRLLLENITLTSQPKDGIFLTGLKIDEPKYVSWLKDRRSALLARNLLLDSDTRLAVSPCVAILPFASVGSNAEENHFGDLVAMDVARALSRSRFLDVISHLSSRQLAGPLLDLGKLKSRLNADYAIGGNVRVVDGQYRLDVDFFQTSTGRILWTEEFHGPVTDILNGDCELVARIARQCGQEVLRASVEIARSAPLPQVAAHALFMTSITGMHQHQLASFARSRDTLEELISRLPGHSKLHAWLAKWYILSIAQGWSIDVPKDSQIAADCTARALDLNPDCATSLTIDGMIQGDRSEDMSLALSRFQSAIEIDPNQGLAWLMYSRLNSFQGKGSSAVEFAVKAKRLSPLDPHGYFYDVMASLAHLVDGDFDTAKTLVEKSLKANPRHTSSYRVLAIAQMLSGDGDKARATVGTLRQLEPNLTVQSYLSSHPAGHLPIGADWAQALADAGLPSN